MTSLIINEDNLTLKEIQEFNNKARAILIDESNQILIANYGGVILLPGGKIDDEEAIDDAIIRELQEEIGQTYTKAELYYIVTLDYYQRNYLKRNNEITNRLVKTHYFLGDYKKVLNNNQNLTAKEQESNFKLQLVSLEKLEDMILKNVNNNPRNIYFQKELITILNFLKNTLI